MFVSANKALEVGCLHPLTLQMENLQPRESDGDVRVPGLGQSCIPGYFILSDSL